MITIQLLCFAQLTDRLGEAAVCLTLPSGATGRDVLAALCARDAALAPLLAVSRLAVHCEYVSWDCVLHDGDELAMVPPVSGG